MIYYVNAKASRDGDGSKAMPFRHINDAARLAVAGDEIVVAPGIYRESVNPIHPGTADARITYRSETPLGAVITGAETLTGWTRFRDNVWVNRVDNGAFTTPTRRGCAATGTSPPPSATPARSSSTTA